MTKRSAVATRATRDALAILGNQIKAARVQRGWTQAGMAERLGVDGRTLSAVESGSASVAIGTAFNAAFLVGVNLFGLEGDELALARRRGEETLALLPKRTRASSHRRVADDDF